MDKGADTEARNETDYCEPNQLTLIPTKKGRNTSLGLAASHGHLPLIEYLLNAGADINAANNQGQTALHLAVANGHQPIVEFLAKRDVSLDSKSVKLAAEFGFLEILKFLLSEGAPLESKRLIGTVALNVAAEEGHLEIVKYLLEKEESDDILTIFHAAKGGDYDTLQYLLCRKKVYLDSCDLKKEWIPLHAAIEHGHLESVKLLIEAGADVNYFREPEIKTPLHFAAQNGSPEIVKFLLSKGAEVSAMGEFAGTPLDVASEYGHLESVNILFEAERSTEKAESGMINAAAKGHLDVVNYFLEKGVNANSRWGPRTVIDPRGNSMLNRLKNEPALYWATKDGSIDVVRCLIEHGADFKTKSGFCILSFLVRLG